MPTEPTNVREIVAAWLRQHGYDGLCVPYQECGCILDDLMPCDAPTADCLPGYHWPPGEDDATMSMFTSREAIAEEAQRRGLDNAPPRTAADDRADQEDRDYQARLNGD